LSRPPKTLSFSKAEVGERIRRAREAQSITQVELAKTLGITQSNVSEIERGVRGVTTHQLVRLAKALRISTDEILVDRGAKAERAPTTSLKVSRRLQRIEALPQARQRVILKVLDALLAQEGSRL
jgi:transcriptional regulator with XRE-family HTH domain